MPKRLRDLLSLLAQAPSLVLAQALAGGITLEYAGSYRQPEPVAAFDRSASEIVAYDVASRRLYITNGYRKTIDIVAIADVYDALTSKRPYKDAFSHEKSIEIMLTESERFDPELFKLFIDNEEEFNFTRIEYDKEV